MAFFLDALLISILWAILCIPVFTIGAATAAVHKVAYNWMRNRSECTVSDFWAAFLANFKSGTLVWLILLAPLVLIVFNGFTVWMTELEANSLAYVLTLLAAVVWLSTAVYAFPLQALFENKPLRTVGNALRIAASYLATTLILDALILLALVMTVLLPAGAVLYIPACAFLGARPVWGVFRKVMQLPTVQKDPEGENT